MRVRVRVRFGVGIRVRVEDRRRVARAPRHQCEHRRTVARHRNLSGLG